MGESATVNQVSAEIVITPSDILFECPACGKSLVVDEAAEGLTVECPKCHINVIVPPKEEPRGPATSTPGVKPKPSTAASKLETARTKELQERVRGLNGQLKELQTQRTELSNRIASRSNEMNRDLVLLARLDTSQQQVLAELGQLLKQLDELIAPGSAEPKPEPAPTVLGASISGRTRVSFRD
jgi:phage FluMu protein Com